MLEKVRKYVQKWNMLKSEDCVIVGVSGGADSICLLLVLIELRKEIGFDIIAVHVNHGIRGAAADADEEYVKRFCLEQGILCESYFANVELIAKNRKQSTEETGREIRRDFFEQALRLHHGTKIALAHHQNDSAETFLFNLARGTGMKGLGGISPVKGNVIRPLLCVERSEIVDYLQRKGIGYCEDQTNESDEYTRNRIRRHVLPYLKEEINTKVVEHMNETMEQLRQVQEFLELQTREYLEQSVRKTDGGYIVLEEAYRKAPDVIKPLLLKQVMVNVSGREKDLESVHVRQLQDLFEKQTGRRVELPYQMQARRGYQGVEIGLKEKKEEIPEEILVDLQEGDAAFGWGKQAVQCRMIDKIQINNKSFEKNHTKWFDCDIIQNKLSFRTRREGDYITIHPDGRTQKLKSYFINAKIPKEERDKILLIADGSHIIWIVGYRLNPVYRIKENTKHVLEIRIDKGESYGRGN